jgi:hypothetical protein
MDPVLVKDLYALLFTLSLFILFGSELYFSKKAKIVRLSNNMHLAYYTLPLVTAMIFMVLGFQNFESNSLMYIGLIAAIVAFYIYMMTQKKIILRNADYQDIQMKVKKFLAKEKITYRQKDPMPNVKSYELHSTEGTLDIRSNGRWVEIFGRKIGDNELMKRLTSYVDSEMANLKYLKPKDDRLYTILMVVTLLFFFYNLYVNHMA